MDMFERTMTFINESIHLHGTGKLSNFLNKLVCDILGYAPAIMRMNFFLCKLNIISLLLEIPQKFIPYITGE